MPETSPEPAQRRFRIPPLLQYPLKFALGGGAIWFLIRSGHLEPQRVVRAFGEHPGSLAAALASYLVLVLAAAWSRWYLLLRLAGLKPAPGRVFNLFMIGLFFNSLIPGGTGGDLVKGYYLFKEHKEEHKVTALATIAMDRFVGLYALLLVALIMAGLNLDLWKDSAMLRANGLFYAGVFAAFSAAVAFYFSPWSGRLLRGGPAAADSRLARIPGMRFLRALAASLAVYRERPLSLLLPLLLGITVDLGLILLYYFCAGALGLGLPLRVHGFVVPVLTMINGIPISPSGVGVGEAAGKVVYGTLGVTSGGEVLVLVHLVILAVSMMGAPFYLLYRARK